MVDGFGDASFAHAAAAARAEWRSDEEEWAAAALEQWRHGRTLVDAAREHLHRGDTIAIATAGSRLPPTGVVIGVADDVIAIESRGPLADVHLADVRRVDVHMVPGAPIAWRVLHRAAHGGTRGIALGSFRARLLELEMTGARVELGASIGEDQHRGSLTVGRDHVVLVDADDHDEDPRTWVIALSAVQWVRPATPS